MTTYNVTNGPATITGGAGSDTLNVTFTESGGVDMQSFSGDLASGYSGVFNGPGASNVFFSGIENFGFFDLGDGPDLMVTGAGDDTLSSGAGDDWLNSGAGVDDIDGGAGLDTWVADKSFATAAIAINLTAGLQTYLGTGSVQNIEAFGLTTGSGNDTLQGTTANLADSIDGGAGDDLIILPQVGSDTVAGGSGSDTLVVVQSADGGVDTNSFAADASGYSGTLDGPGGNNLYFSGIENFSFTDTGLGNDNIQTGNGADTLNGGAGDDWLNSGGGSDVVNGGDGLDTWVADKSFTGIAMNINLSKAAPQTYFGGGSVVNVEAFRLTAGSGNDTLQGTTANLADSIDGGGGDDLIILPQVGSDTVAGGSGSDTLVVIQSADGGVDTTSFAADASGYSGTLDGPGGNNLYFSGVENFSITDTGVGNDNIQTGNGADTLRGGAGDDWLNSGGGSDVVDGGDGLDTWAADKSASGLGLNINIAKAQAQKYYGGGSVANVEAFHLTAGSGADRLQGTFAVMADYIDAGAGNDVVLLPLSGSDTVAGGEGSDALVILGSRAGGMAMNSLTADASGYSGWIDGPGGDNLYFSGIDRFKIVATGEGNDLLVTGGGKDTLNGGVGDDVLNGGSGPDIINGGDGLDYWIADRSAVTDTINIDLSVAGIQGVGGGGSIRAIEGMSLVSGSGDDRIHTSNDFMNDSIMAGGGDDLLAMVLRGSDTVDGGTGRDRLSLSFGGDSVGLTATLDSNGYSGTFDGPGGNNLYFSGVEDFSIIAGGENDSLGGYTGDDLLNGAVGDDTLQGGDGADTLLGGGGADVLSGGLGRDSLDGGIGKDRLIGGAGKDYLTGGAAADRFVFASVTDSGNGALRDVILDFEAGDKIDLAGIDANAGVGGDQAFVFIGSAGFHGTAGELRAVVGASSTLVYGDVDGDRVADFTIEVAGAPSLAAGDFVL